MPSNPVSCEEVLFALQGRVIQLSVLSHACCESLKCSMFVSKKNKTLLHNIILKLYKTVVQSKCEQKIEKKGIICHINLANNIMNKPYRNLVRNQLIGGPLTCIRYITYLLQQTQTTLAQMTPSGANSSPN